MNKQITRIAAVLGFIAIASLLLLCSATLNAEDPATKAKQWDGDPSTFIESHRGQVVLLVLGMEGCPGTAAITETLKDYSTKKAEGVAIARLDVPPPGMKLDKIHEKPLPFEYGTDKERIVAKQLDFFYYPTFYILDKDGEVRFSGDCDKKRLPEMVEQILKEKLGDKKHIFTPPMLAEGTDAPSFTGKNLDGKKTTFKELKGEQATVLIFARTGCPFSKAAIPGMKKLQESFADKKVTVLIINKDESADDIRSIYEKDAPGVTVLVDNKAEISKAFGVSPVPFCFVLDGVGKIVKRMPYTEEAAADAINLALGVTSGTSTPAQSGGG